MTRLLKNVAVLSGWVFFCAFPGIILAQTTDPKVKPAPAKPAPRPAPAPKPARSTSPPSKPAARATPPQKSPVPERSSSSSSNSTKRQKPAPAAAQTKAAPEISHGTGAAQTQSAYNLPRSAATAHGGNGPTKLNGAGSKSVVKQINSARAGMGGVNGMRLPKGSVTVHGSGNLTVEAADGVTYGVRQNGTLSSYSARGRSVAFAPNGRIQSVHTATLDIRRGVHGERTVVTRRPDNSVLVSTGAHRGYLERTVVSGKQTYTARIYYAGGVTYTRVYGTYAFGGAILPYYLPGVYYSSAFYGWAFYPWANPIAYSWGWGGAPWFNSNGGYFSPAASYPNGSAWLTDYYLSRTMAGAYDDQAQPGDSDGGGPAQADDAAYPTAENMLAAAGDTPITPEVKELINDEVHRQLAYENAIASGTAQPAVAELPWALQRDRIFVVSSNLNVSASDDQTCTLSAGDVLQLATPPGDGMPLAGLRVSASRRADCPAGTVVSLSAQDLAEMQNNLRAHMDAGLATMRTGQGQLGLPSAPEGAMAQAPRSALDVPLPPDPNVGALLDAQQAEARRTEADSMKAVTAALR